MRLLVLTVVEPVAGREPGEQALVTMFDDDSATIAFRSHTWETWSPPYAVTVDEPTDGPIG